MAKGDKLWDSLTTAQLKEIGDAARVGCRNKNIAAAMEIPEMSFLTCDKLCAFTHKKRALWRQELRHLQHKHAKSTPVMTIFLGKNELGQTDKREDTHKVDEATASLLGLVDGATRGKLPSDE